MSHAGHPRYITTVSPTGLHHAFCDRCCAISEYSDAQIDREGFITCSQCKANVRVMDGSKRVGQTRPCSFCDGTGRIGV